MTTPGSSIAGLMADAAESMRRGQSAAAVSHWQHVLKLDPEHAAALNYLGAHALAQGDRASAREYLQHAANADHDTVEGMMDFYGENADLGTL